MPCNAQVFLLGKGTVGGALLDRLGRARGVTLVGLADSRRCVFDRRGILARWRERLDAARAGFDAGLVDELAALPDPVLVDCTAAEGMDELYARALAAGVRVVSANKKPFAGASATYQRVRAVAHETTVGAALPVIGPLADLARVGDEVRRIEACLSGTLGYLAGELERGTPLVDAVREARALGYTEPDPRDDLSGVDVARKALILARALGLAIEPDQVELAPFVALGDGDLDDELRAADARLVRQADRVLRYLATIEVPERRITVGPRWVDRSHPAAAIAGSDALVVVESALYSPRPLRIQGPGAGGAITASGVLADVLRIPSSPPP